MEKARDYLSQSATGRGYRQAVVHRECREVGAGTEGSVWVEALGAEPGTATSKTSIPAQRFFLVWVRPNEVRLTALSSGSLPKDLARLPWHTILRGSLGVGDEWHPDPARRTIVKRVAGVADLELPGGRRSDCLRIVTVMRSGPAAAGARTSAEVLVAETWYAPGAGLVAERLWGPTGQFLGLTVLLGSHPASSSQTRAGLEYLTRYPQGPATR